jgi:hypothetical protein
MVLVRGNHLQLVQVVDLILRKESLPSGFSVIGRKGAWLGTLVCSVFREQ